VGCVPSAHARAALCRRQECSVRISRAGQEGARYDALASDLVRLEVDVIVATTSVAIAAAKQATQRIPIVRLMRPRKAAQMR